MVTIKRVTNKKDLKKFVKFPISLYRNNEYFVPKYHDDEMNYFSPNKNDAFTYCESQQFLAYIDKKVVGRICTIINHRYNNEKKVKQIRFSRFDTIDDLEVTKALFTAVKEEAIKNELNEIVGPLGFSNLDECGLLVQGFNHLGDYYNSYNSEYYQEHLQSIGFIKDFEWNYYRFNVSQEANTHYDKMSSFILKKYNLRIKEINKSDNIYQIAIESLKLRAKQNGYKYGYNELTEKQIKTQAENFKFLLNMQYTYIVVDANDEIVAFCYAVPSLSKAFKKSSGHSNVISKLRINKYLNKNDYVYLHSLIVNQKYQNISLELVIINAIIEKAKENNVIYICTGDDMQYNDNFVNSDEFNKELVKIRCSYKMKIK